MTVVETLVHDLRRIPNREDIEAIWLAPDLYAEALAECHIERPEEFLVPIVSRSFHIHRVLVRRLGER